MAIDKAVDSSVLDAGLKAIADAIREKGGTSDSLAFPDAMAAAISAIEAGEAGMSVVTGTFTLASSAQYADIEHNLGVIPKIAFFASSGIANARTVIAGGYCVTHGFGMVLSSSREIWGSAPAEYDITTTESGAGSVTELASQMIYAATENTIRFGNEVLPALYSIQSGDAYNWLVAG